MSCALVQQVASAFVKLELAMGKSIALMIAPGEGARAERQNWTVGVARPLSERRQPIFVKLLVACVLQALVQARVSQRARGGYHSWRLPDFNLTCRRMARWEI
jgi:hypothetical protein